LEASASEFGVGNSIISWHKCTAFPGVGGGSFSLTFRIILGERAGVFLDLPFFAFWRFDWLLDYVKAVFFLEEWNRPGTPFAVNAAEKSDIRL